MRILITGASGQVGTDLCQQADRYGFTVLAPNHSELDITDRKLMEIFVAENQPNIIINSAAYTAVDKAEEDEESASEINAQGPKILAMIAYENKIPLLHLSTDYVYSGDKEGPYVETDMTSPIGVYGETKNQGEIFVREALDQHVILRTSWVFGIEGNNFVKTMIKASLARSEIGVVVDQKGCPTFSGDIAGALLAIANDYSEGKEIPWGTYHFCGAEATSWYEFAEAIFEEAINAGVIEFKPTVRALRTEEYPTLAKRPANSVMCCDKFIAAFPLIGQSSWKPGLTKVAESFRFNKTNSNV